jgi:nucleoside-diphosphate-sugar epimerase
MAIRRVLVTGAGSYLGDALIRALARLDTCEVTALGSPRWDASGPARVQCWRADLTRPLKATIADAVMEADSVLHLAWTRGANPRTVQADNAAMLTQLIEDRLDRVTFTSTVAAGPNAPSVYGRTKQMIADRVAQAGGRVLVLGGVIGEPPGGSYAELCRSVATSRLALRFAAPEPQLHITTRDTVIAELIACAYGERSPGIHAVFDRTPVGINAFMADLEARAPRARLPTPVWTQAVVGAARGLRRTHAGPFLDRLVSFIGRDQRWLSELNDHC